MGDMGGEKAFYSLPDTGWGEVEPDVCVDILKMQRSLEATLDWIKALRPEVLAVTSSAESSESEAGEIGEPGLAPAQLAVRSYELANRLWGVAGDQEQSLRQVISTLRTAFAVCWDLYSPGESERITVAQHMIRLRETIEDFQRDLDALQRERHIGDVGEPSA